MPYGNVKAGIAATSSVFGSAIAYNQYGTTGSGNHPQTKNSGNFQKYLQTSSQINTKNEKLHEDAAKQMQMWKF